MSAAAAPTASWQGPLRLAAAIVVVGVLFVWLIKPIGNPCPDLGRLPQGSSARSSPSFSPPGTRTCEYTAAGGIKATSKYIPWIDWILILLVAAVAAGGARMLAPAGRRGGAERAPRPEREPRAPQAVRPPKAPRAPKSERAMPGERDAAARERARAERAERARRDH